MARCESEQREGGLIMMEDCKCKMCGKPFEDGDDVNGVIVRGTAIEPLCNLCADEVVVSQLKHKVEYKGGEPVRG